MQPGRRLSPDGTPASDAANHPWVVVLSDWSERPAQELVRRVGAIVRNAGPREPIPIVLIVDDLGRADAEHRMLLSELVEAGGMLLQPESEQEGALVRHNPLGFAAEQLAAALQTNPVPTSAPPPAGVSEPDGYKDFARAVTRLSPEALQDVIEGRRSDD